MYRCETCNKVSRPRDSQQRVVVETRPVVYRKMVEEVTTFAEDPVHGPTPPTTSLVEKVIGEGWEVVREVKVCAPCATRIQG